MPLWLPQHLAQRIWQHACRTFPEECCGVLLGEDSLDAEVEVRRITDVMAVDNEKVGERARRYLIDPPALLAAEHQARGAGVDVMGIYHSHPNHPSRASEFDRVHAMPFWSYIIVSCMDGVCVQTQSWRLRHDRSQFDEETYLLT